MAEEYSREQSHAKALKTPGGVRGKPEEKGIAGEPQRGKKSLEKQAGPRPLGALKATAKILVQGQQEAHHGGAASDQSSVFKRRLWNSQRGCWKTCQENGGRV